MVGTRTANPSSFPARQLLAELGDEFRPLAAAGGIELRMVPSSLWLHTDRGLLYRLLQNLLGNAIRYTERGAVLLSYILDPFLLPPGEVEVLTLRA